MRCEVLYLVIPCYNEEEVLPETTRQLTEKMNDLMARGLIAKESRIVYVNDGSKDNTWALIERYHKENPLVDLCIGVFAVVCNAEQRAGVCGMLDCGNGDQQGVV